MKQFTIPFTYRSSLIADIKQKRKLADKMKKDFTPSLLEFEGLKIYLARHFGFCYGVENAIEIAFKTIEENAGKRIFLLSEMIHNPKVNADLINLGVTFLQDTKGNQLIDFSELNEDDVVIIPAFGTTLNIENKLKESGIKIEKYNTTCPFVEKVWNRSEQIAKQGFSIIVHGKPSHEETRATFSHASSAAPTLVINDMQEAQILAKFISGELPINVFDNFFEGRYSENFIPEKSLDKIGVVNQTTMLAAETQGISDFLKSVMAAKYPENTSLHFADTRDTLCYATNDNQSAVYGLLEQEADIAIVVGGYNSSNTSHLVELCEAKLPTYFIKDESKIISQNIISHFDLRNKIEKISENYLHADGEKRILLTAGASCPDAVVESVILKLKELFSV
ncbi:MAG: 4-hydroxy-3-methylbut-2-enyl diphosphate reductase [Bacteroidetes bacterium]|nr:4-hydroxy-3-methylbut-2-enyl diphosphate reductase [Bacteroidota bacterium]